jgi:hypothetical protein
VLRDPRAEADVLGRLWPLARDRGDLAMASQWVRDAIALHHRVGNTRAEAALLCVRVLLTLDAGGTDRAALDEAIAFCHQHDLADLLEELAEDAAPRDAEWAAALRAPG